MIALIIQYVCVLLWLINYSIWEYYHRWSQFGDVYYDYLNTVKLGPDRQHRAARRIHKDSKTMLFEEQRCKLVATSTNIGTSKVTRAPFARLLLGNVMVECSSI